MIKDDELGFDLDEDTVRLIDAIIVNIATDDEVKDEFKKLSFIKKLGDNYNNTPGPIEQLLDKVAKIEKHKFEESQDLRRVIADMEHLARTIEKYLPPQAKQAIKGTHEVNRSLKYYSFK